MNFRIADTFTDSLARLTNEEQKAVKTTAFDLQMNPANPGMNFHRIERAKDPNFWSVRVNRDIRLIVHKTNDSLLLCYVDHHDKAYQWAERRRLEVHPKTGAAQLVVIREQVQDIIVPRYVEEDQPPSSKPMLFAEYSDDELLSWGVPVDWLNDVRQADEDSILEIAEMLPQEASEALLELAVGNQPVVPAHHETVADPFAHPDAGRRFRAVTDAKELERALEYPWEKWTIFLHPAQKEYVERDYAGPARISGSAGTGKTIVALHRAVYLAKRHPDARVLLTTFSDALANALRTKLARLIHHEPRIAERLEVYAMNAIGERLYAAIMGRPRVVGESEIRSWLEDAAKDAGITGFSPSFLYSEWKDVVDAWQLEAWEAYRDVARLGRKTRLSETKRAQLWEVFEGLRRRMAERQAVTHAGIFARLAEHIRASGRGPFDFYIVDEAQDIGVTQLRFLAAAGSVSRPDALFFTGDLGQRIFQQPFSWKSLGVEIRGRSRTLRINYRTTQQIRRKADRLLDPEIADVDGNVEDRSGTVSLLNGPEPEVMLLDSEADEISTVSKRLDEWSKNGMAPDEMAIFVRSEPLLDRALAAVQKAGLPHAVLDEHGFTVSGKVSVGSMHNAKGLEFRAVCVMGCDDEILPMQERIEAVADEADLDDVYHTERHLLYVACTRARDHLVVTGIEPGSEFLEDLLG